jgi:hypothetical protein
MRSRTKGRQTRIRWFVSVIGLWTLLSSLCYSGVVVIEGNTLGGAVLLGFVLTYSILGIVALLKIQFDRICSIVEESS